MVLLSARNDIDNIITINSITKIRRALNLQQVFFLSDIGLLIPAMGAMTQITISDTMRVTTILTMEEYNI